MRILHVNVRLQEGGAARVALDLHRQLLGLGVESQFAYGWGERGGKSSGEVSIQNCFQVGRQLQVASNMLLHRMVGIDFLEPIGEGRRRLIEAIHWADVVHLHVVHSYFLPLTWLVKELVRTKKIVVWTAHDYWMLTGRCAFTEGCEGWRDGCGICPTQKNYPPAYIDFSAGQFRIKRNLIAELGKQLHVVTPSEFVAQAIRLGLPNVKVQTIPNWIDSEFEVALRDISLSNLPMVFSTTKIKVIVIANDLSDPTKVNYDLVKQLLTMSHIVLHTVGSASPFSGGNVVNHGRIVRRELMAEIVSGADVALFTSEKDTFGLVMIEALACGVPVFAVDSLAANEVLPVVDIHPVGKISDIVKLLSEKELPACYLGVSREHLRSKVFDKFGGTALVKRYRDLYETLVIEKSSDHGA
jgi:putative colanic acid biosynthesis glycosyltransferase